MKIARPSIFSTSGSLTHSWGLLALLGCSNSAPAHADAVDSAQAPRAALDAGARHDSSVTDLQTGNTTGRDAGEEGAHDSGTQQNAGDGVTPPERDGGLMPISVEFRAVVGESDFACGTDYETDVGELSAQDFRFFVSQLALIAQDGSRVDVEIEDRSPFQARGVALLDFEDGTSACSNGTLETNLRVTGKVTPGSYKGIAFSTSVPEALNHRDPSTLPEPLAAGEMSWGWMLGYKFLRVELVSSEIDADGNSAGTILHLGSTECATVGDTQERIECAKPNRNAVTLRGFELGRSKVVADLGALVSSAAGASVLCHSSGETCQSSFETLGVGYDDGAALDTQSLFSLQ